MARNKGRKKVSTLAGCRSRWKQMEGRRWTRGNKYLSILIINQNITFTHHTCEIPFVEMKQARPCAYGTSYLTTGAWSIGSQEGVVMNIKLYTHQQFGTASGASCLQDTTKELLVRASSHPLLSRCYRSFPTRSRCFPSFSFSVCRSIIIRNRVCCFCFMKNCLHKLFYYSIFETWTTTNLSIVLISRARG